MGRGIDVISPSPPTLFRQGRGRYNLILIIRIHSNQSGKFEKALSDKGDRIPRFKYSYPTTPIIAALSVQKEGEGR